VKLLLVLKKLWFLLTAWCLCFQAVANYSDEECCQAQLKAADEIRSSDSLDFGQKLKAISEQSTSLNDNEADYFKYLQAYEFIFKGDFQEALKIFEELSHAAVNSDIKFRSMLSLINAYAIQRRWNEGLLVLNNVLSLLPSIGNQDIKGQSLMVASIFYNQLGQHELGLEYSDRLKQGHIDPRSICFAEQLKFEAVLQLKRSPEELDETYNKGMRQCEIAGEKVLQAIIIKLYAEYLLETLLKPQDAKALLDEHEALVLSAKYAPIIAIYQSLIAKANWQVGDKEAAFDIASSLSINPASMATLEAQIRAQQVLYDYYLDKGDTAKALEAYIKYAEAEKANLDEVKTKTLAFQMAQHQSLEQQNRIALLDEQNKFLTVQQQLDKAEAFNNRLFIVVLLCIALGLGTWGWHSWKNQQRLRQLAEYDGLTGLFSRGHFTQVALSAVDYAKALKAPISCILLDIDKFKCINDTFGHATGDWALRAVAQMCRELCREHEIIGRIGGEEICFLLPECHQDNASQLAQSLRQGLTQLDTSASGHKFDLSGSFGVSCSTISGYKLDKLMQHADNAMYQSKHAGRNRVQVYHSELKVSV
jgi:diguanylate cyclase